MCSLKTKNGPNTEVAGKRQYPMYSPKDGTDGTFGGLFSPGSRSKPSETILITITKNEPKEINNNYPCAQEMWRAPKNGKVQVARGSDMTRLCSALLRGEIGSGHFKSAISHQCLCRPHLVQWSKVIELFLL